MILFKKKASVKNKLWEYNGQRFPNRGGGPKKIKNFPSSKISQVREGGSQNLVTVPKLYLVINYEGFP